MIYVHMVQPQSDSRTIKDVNMEASDISLKSKSKKREAVEEPPLKDSPKKKRHRNRGQDSGGDDQLLDSKAGLKSPDDIRQALLHLIRATTETETKVFTSASTEPSEEIENVDLSANPSFLSLNSYPEVMCELVAMFTKLRRFPKLIAKLLCCFRDYIFNESNLVFTVELNSADIFLPLEFMQSLGSNIAALPVGQMVELFKTFYHNLHEECVKPIIESEGKDCGRRIHFLSIVTSLLSEFLENVKLADYSVTEPTMEKVSEVMVKIRDECLSPLGKIVIIVNESQLVRSFLRLGLKWGEIHAFLVHYRSELYKQNVQDWFTTAFLDPTEANISYIHSYMSSESWTQVCSRIENDEDKRCKALWAQLMIQKLKYMAILGKPISHKGIIDEQSLQTQLRTTTSYILTHQDSCELSLHEVYQLTSQYMDDTQIIELVRHVVRHGSQAENEVLFHNSSLDAKFEVAFCIETIEFIFSRMHKLRVLPKWCRKILTNDLFSNEKKTAVMSSASVKNAAYTAMYKTILEAVNEFVERADELQPEDGNPDFVSDEMILAKLELLNNIFLEDYPTPLKTFVALSSIVYLLVAGAQPGKTNHIVKLITSMLFQTASQPKGNETLYMVSWPRLYKWLCSNAATVGSSSVRNVLLTILRNVYISAKSISEFEIVINTEEFSMDSPVTPIHLITMEFLLKELPVSTQAKSKLTSQLQDHISRLTRVVGKALKKASTKHQRQTANSSLLSNIFRACWLTQLALPNLSSETKTESESTNDYENSITKLKKICCKHVESAFQILHDKSANQEGDVDKCDFDDDHTKFATTFALVFLHGVCKARNELSERLHKTFINQLWTVCVNTTDDDWNACEKIAQSENTNLVAKDLFEMANPEEFSALKDYMLDEMKTTVDDKKQNAKLKALVHILNCLLDATLKNSEQKDARREVLDGVLPMLVKLSLRWNSSNKCLKNMVLPVIEFQTKLLKRKSAMSSAICSATCLSSITSVPLNDITDMKLYREVFCNTAELLNAFTIHRLDVLSFRMPIYLQCFQFLIESVTSRASQDNKLADVEIIHLKYCAHEMERTCQSMKLNQKEFSRVSPYFVAIMMRQFEMFAVYPAVKNPLLSGCYKLLDLCDSHAIAQLNSMLTVGARETFKSVYELYEKFYRYKAKAH